MDFHERYEFNPKTDFLGKGGFSKVYKAHDTLLQRTVALKFFTSSNLGDKYQVLNEIRKVIRFEHSNLCKYYDVALLSSTNIMGETERVEVGIMEYIDGGDFKTYTRKNPQHVEKLLIDILKGLAYLHKHKIAHRDLKPQNILIKTDDDEPVSKITDFGISKLIDADDANSSALLGTVEYMAPEQFNPKKYGINGRIATNLDLWSFGLLVYEALSHQSFFGSRSGGMGAEQVMANILGDTPLAKADELPPKYREIVKRCLVKNATERVQNALELIPLFNETVVPIEKAQPVPASTPDGRTPDKVQVIEREPAVKQTGYSNATAEAPVEEAKVTDLVTEPTTGQTQAHAAIPETPIKEVQITELVPDATDETQVIDAVQEELTEETHAIEFPPEAPEVTQVIESIPKQFDAQTQMPDSNEKKTAEKKKLLLKQTDSEKETKKEKRKPAQKIFLLSLLAGLLIILFIVYPFLIKRDSKLPVSNQKPDEDGAWIPNGMPVKGSTFMMGEPNTDDAALQAHAVTLSDFSLGKYEVTIAQFKKFITDSGYETTAQQKGYSQIHVAGEWVDGKGINWQHDAQGHLITSNTETIPVVHVSWVDANAYCKWLSEKTGAIYRLPTEAEWEFAARDGDSASRFIFSGSNSIDLVGWYKDNSGGALHPIGKKQPNALGLYDLTGNALEWCNDWYDAAYYKNSAKVNPMGPATPAEDSSKVLRGGAWGFEKEYCRSRLRHWFKADESGGSTGFRVCKVN